MPQYRPFISKILATTAITAGLVAAPAMAQSSTAGNAANTGDDIIVTAQRIEQRLQDVPISISVLGQEALAKRNIVSTADLGNYIPSLSTDAAFGSQKTSFVIRGFTQEGKTSPSVGVYFADVIAPRSFGGTTSGNGAGVGSMFDLQNVQVLKGPQGTLFGRNTTGGSILLVPTKPNDKLEGYIDGTLGDYNLHRVQAVLNIPVSDTFKVRLGIDSNQRDGYLKNLSGIGPKDFDNVNYIAARLSVVANLTPDLENYMIASFSRSNTHGDLGRVLACGPTTGFGPLATLLNPYGCAQAAREQKEGFWTAENSNTDPYERVTQWQVINTTTWDASDSLRVKNIASYAEYREQASFSLFGDNLLYPPGTPDAGQFFSRTFELHPGFSGNNSAQSTFTEEFQLQGHIGGDKLIWQAGAYLEISKPLGFNSGLTPIFTNCTDIATLNCQNLITLPVPVPGVGVIQYPVGEVSDSRTEDTFNNKGFYAQATYKATDKLSFTGGIRYTIDKMTDLSQNSNIFVPVPGVGVRTCQNVNEFGTGVVSTPLDCQIIIKKKWQKPTWLIEGDYKFSSDMMVYAKWSRGYRQGSINSNNVGLEVVGPEKVDTYEGGAKASFHGPVSGYFNIAGFYNNFRDQQIAVNPVIAPDFQGKVPNSQPIINAGKSRIWGVEIDSSITPFHGFTLDTAYAYLNTKLQSITLPNPIPIYYSALYPSADVGQPLALSPKNRVTVTGTYTLPLDSSIGKVSFGATFTHTDSNRAVSPTISPNFYLIQASNLLNANASWNSVFGKPFDISFFMTNVTNQKLIVYPTTSLLTAGFEGGYVNAPRMFGFDIRYRFGA